MTLLETIQKNRLYLDGAMGSELIARGLSTECAEQYNLTMPEVVSQIHNSYLEAGCRLIYTNTFGANEGKSKSGPHPVCEVIRAGVRIARECADRFGAFVAYDAGPTGQLLEPFGRLSVSECYRLYAEQAEAVKDSGADCVVVETMTDTLELKQAILAFREITHLPVFASMSFSSSGRTFHGCTVESFAHIAQGLGAEAIGVNCSLGAKGLLEITKNLIPFAHVPIFVKPNAGLPIFQNGRTCYDTDADTFSGEMAEIAKTGVSMLGGCCGTTPEYLSKTIERTKGIPFKLYKNRVFAVCGSAKSITTDRPLVCGERLNPTGKPFLKQAIINDDFDTICSLSSEQCFDGADVLDVNAGIAGIDEAAKLEGMVRRVQAVCEAPLMIDSTNPSALERALAALNGIGIINSVNAEESSLAKILPIAQKYGAFLVGLCLDEKGIPASAEDRLALAEKIVSRAAQFGIAKERIFLDALTMSAAVDVKNPLVTLDTLRQIKEKLSVKTVLGLSNVSYGLPRRERMNAAFYRMALAAGLDLAIVHPKLRPEADPVSDRALLGQDLGLKDYLKKYSGEAGLELACGTYSAEDCIVKGLRKEAGEWIASHATPKNFAEVIDREIIPSLNKLGELYEKGKAFLPQLMGGADAAKVMLDYVREHFQSGGEEAGEVMVMATVEGDVHDIGKNIVKAVLRNYGYRIVDLGKNVPAEEVLSAVKEHHARFVGLSALMTTTLPGMARTVRLIKDADPSVVVAVGGAVVTREFADSVGADIYGENAQETAKRLQERRKQNG